MCLHPILIKNPYLNSPIQDAKFNIIHDTVNSHLAVPCGNCSVCLQLKQQYITQRVQMESLNHDLYFGTLTYNNEMLPYVSVSSDLCLSYADIDDWQCMIKMIRKHEDLPPFKYMLVSEYGGRRHRPHFHFILSFPHDSKSILSERVSFGDKLHSIFLKYWKRNINLTDKLTKNGKIKKNTRFPIWKSLCTYVRTKNSYNFDLHYLYPYASSSGLDDVAFYVSKYCLKYDKWTSKLKSKLFFTLSEDKFKEVWNTIKPRRLMSKGFGSPDDPDVINHILKGINSALLDISAMYPFFFSPVNGASFPLAPYYSKRFLTVDAACTFVSRRPSFLDQEQLSFQQIEDKERKFQIIKDFLSESHTLQDDAMNNINNIQISNLYGILETADFSDQDFADCWQDF